METIEIRQNKKRLIPMLAFMTAALLGMTYYIFLSGKFDGIIIIKAVFVVAGGSLAYVIYIAAKKLFKNEPVLIIDRNIITIHEKGKPASYLWQQVTSWKIEKEKDGPTEYLIIKTADSTKKVNISWLDRSPFEIEQLIHQYKPLQ